MSDEISGLYAAVDKSKKNMDRNFNSSASKQSQDTYATLDYQKQYKSEICFDSDEKRIVPSIDGGIKESSDFQVEGGHNDKQTQSIFCGKSPLWMFYSLLALMAFNIAAIAALAGAFSAIAGYRSEISAVKESLNYRCQQLYLSNVLFLNKSEMSFLKLSQDTASRINVMDEAILNNLQLLNNLSILLNKSRSQTLLQHQLIHGMISQIFLNFSARLKERNDEVKKGLEIVGNNCKILVNYSASTLANDLKNLHVFKSCDTIEALTLPFPSGTYKIGSLTNNTMMSCSTNSVSTCKGVLGQWRRIAYLNTSKGNWKCPGRLI